MDAQRIEFFERLLQMKPVFDRLCEIAASKLLQAAESGHELQFFKVTKGRRFRDWAADADALIAQFGDGILEPPKDRAVMSPAQAETKFSKGDLKPFISTKDGALKIAPITSILAEVSINASEFN